MNDSQLQKKFAGGAGSRSPQTAAKGHVRTVIRKDAPRSYKVCVAKRVPLNEYVQCIWQAVSMYHGMFVFLNFLS